jgi:hypothetical protein
MVGGGPGRGFSIFPLIVSMGGEWHQEVSLADWDVANAVNPQSSQIVVGCYSNNNIHADIINKII